MLPGNKELINPDVAPFFFSRIVVVFFLVIKKSLKIKAEIYIQNLDVLYVIKMRFFFLSEIKKYT